MRRGLAIRSSLALAIALPGVAPAFAQDPVGCDKFKWPVDMARAALSTANQQVVASGAEVTTVAAEAVNLKPEADAKLPIPPERQQKAGTFAGFVTVTNLAAGTYMIGVSDSAWVDVVQNDTYVKPKDFSGVTGCAYLRKALKFDLATAPATIQLSGVEKNTINLVILPTTY
jgi:hypothetical protein